jgi:O-succinylbenzoic acid--CoA ligase
MDRFDLARLLGTTPHVGEPRTTPVAIAEADPGAFMAAFAAAVGEGGPVFLADPHWGEPERVALRRLMAQRASAVADGAAAARGWLMIPSGGSSGEIKFARHDEDTLAAAVLGFGRHFRTQQVNAIGLLPLHHVSGLMAWMRCVLTGGSYRPWDWKRLERGDAPRLPVDGDWFLSLVPTQLQRLLAQPELIVWLRQFRAIFLGGGPTWPELSDVAAQAGLPLVLSYGMTETAAMVAAQRPDEFAAGARNSGSAMPHARIEITPEGTVRIGGDSVYRGYWPEWREERAIATEDLGQLDGEGRLTILGRRDAVIITGGKKVAPNEVEAALRATGYFADVAVIGVPDGEWGQAIVACYPAGGRSPDLSGIAGQLGRLQLAAHKHPKRYVAVKDWPRNAQGKINRAALLAQVK